MKVKIVSLLITACFALTAAPACLAEETAAPDIGNLHNDFFRPELSAMCGAGDKLSRGCQAIRAREVVDASEYPWKAIGRVNFASRQLQHHCTGTLVQERLVLTASNCLYNFARKSWIPAESIRFVAGYQRGSFEAISEVERYILDPVQDLSSRDFRADVFQNWALLVLKEPIGRDAGMLATYQEDVTGFDDASFALAGYSGLRPHVLSVANDCGIPGHDRSRKSFLQKCSATFGDFGAPAIVYVNGEMAVWGVFVGIRSSRSEFVSISIPISGFWSVLTSELGKLQGN